MFLIDYLGGTFGLEEFTHGRKPNTVTVRYLVESPLQEVEIVGVFRIVGRGRNVHLAILTIPIVQIYLLCD